MTKERLAIFGGKPIRAKDIPPHSTTDKEEIDAAVEVIRGGRLSLFEGSYKPDPPFSFNGGPYVQKLEREWERYYNVKHAITVNSATSGLYAAIGALGIAPGDEVIVSPYTMSASVTCALVYNAIPIFADIREEIFALDPESIMKAITPRTKAIVVVHLFGHPAQMDEIMEIAEKQDIKVIEDCAQVHGAHYKGRYVGTIGDVGIFSLNCNKTIQTGEGGVITTNDDDLAQRLRLIRNHGEVVVGSMGIENIANTFGWNYRMTEIEAAMASVQLKKLKALNNHRIKLASYLTKKLSGIEGIKTPVKYKDCDHVYYVYALRYFENIVGVPRNAFVQALNAEGIPFYEGYSRPIYLHPMFQKKIAYGSRGCPFTCHYYKGSVNYKSGLCPTAERLYSKEVMLSDIVRYPLKKEDMDDIVTAFYKILNNLDELKSSVQIDKGSSNDLFY